MEPDHPDLALVGADFIRLIEERVAWAARQPSDPSKSPCRLTPAMVLSLMLSAYARGRDEQA